MIYGGKETVSFVGDGGKLLVWHRIPPLHHVVSVRQSRRRCSCRPPFLNHLSPVNEVQRPFCLCPSFASTWGDPEADETAMKKQGMIPVPCPELLALRAQVWRTWAAASLARDGIGDRLDSAILQEVPLRAEGPSNPCAILWYMALDVIIRRRPIQRTSVARITTQHAALRKGVSGNKGPGGRRRTLVHRLLCRCTLRKVCILRISRGRST